MPLGSGRAAWDAGVWRPFAASLPPAPAGVPAGGRAQVGVSKRPPETTASGAGAAEVAGASAGVGSAADDRVSDSGGVAEAGCAGAPAAPLTAATLAPAPAAGEGAHGGSELPAISVVDAAVPTAAHKPATGKRGKDATCAGAAVAAASPHGRPPPLPPSAYIAFGTDWRTAEAVSAPGASVGATPRSVRDCCRAPPHVTFADPAPEVLLPDTGTAAAGTPASAGGDATADCRVGAAAAAATSRGGHGRSPLKGKGKPASATRPASTTAASAPVAHGAS